MKFILFFIATLMSLNAKYMNSKSCSECHEMIYYEHSKSMHYSSSLFKDEFHRKMKELNYPDTYDCAVCHSPAAKNLEQLVSGEHQPSQSPEELDGVSCVFCHQIAKIEKSHRQNTNITTYGRDGKQLFYGNLKNPETSDKHDSLSLNPIYKNSQMCMGCHSHKYNKYDVEICNSSLSQIETTSDCIGCHMPKNPGGATKLNKRGRSEYASHELLGVRNEEFVKKAVELELKQDGNKIELFIKNKMGHPIIMQPMRLKYVRTEVLRDGKVIWKNFENSPYEDKQVAFSVLFEDENGKQVYPPKAKKRKYELNLDINSTKIVVYEVPQLQKGDKIESTWESFVVRPSLAKELDLHDEATVKKYIGVSTSLIVR